jgi:hypothetical protein
MYHQKVLFKSFPKNGYVGRIRKSLDNFCVPPLGTEVTISTYRALKSKKFGIYSVL